MAGLASCSDGARHELAIESKNTLDIGPDKQPAVTRVLPRGVYLVEVRELEIDVRVTVLAPGVRAELEDKVPRHGSIFKVVSLPERGELCVELRSADHRTKLGRAELSIARWQETSAGPPSRLQQGFTAFGEAGEQTALATPDSWARAADKLHEAMADFEAAGDDSTAGQAAYALAWVQYASRDQYTAAVLAAEIATKAFEAVDDETGVHGAATVRAAAEIELAAGMNAGTQRAEQHSMYESADRRLKDAAAFFSAHGRPVQAEYAVNMRAVRALGVGDDTAGESLLKQAVQMARDNHDVGEQAKSLANLATLHNMRGYIAQAAQEYEALMPIFDRDAKPYIYGVLLGNYGFCLIALGDFDRALQMQLQALEIYTKVGDQDERATALSALGNLYLRMGDAERALETLRSAIVAQEKYSDARGLASTLRVAGNAASLLGQHDSALAYLRRSAEIDADAQNIARTNVLIAGELRESGDLRAAETALEKPLASTNELVQAAAFEERARLRGANHDAAAAIRDLRAADLRYEKLGLEFNRIDTNASLAQQLLVVRDVEGAGMAADTAVAIASRIRTRSANPEWRARFVSARYSPFEARIAVDLASGAEGDPRASWRAFRTADQIRARSLADELAFDASGGARSNVDETALRARLTSQQLRLEASIQRQDTEDADLAEMRRAVEETRAQLDNNRLKNGGVAANQVSLPASLRQVQQKLPPDTVVLAYFVGDTSSHAWLLTKSGIRHESLPGKDSLQEAVDQSIAEQRDRSRDDRRTRQLGSVLLGHLLDGVGENRMLLIADGPLNSVPFAALPLPGSERNLLIDRFVLGYAPSLALAMQTPVRPRARPTMVAVVSDPVYAPDDRRLHLAATDATGNYRGPLPPSPNNLTRLPYSELEANAVTRAFGAADTIRLSGFDATTNRVLGLPFDDLAILHFATHAQARKDSPEQSALYLSEYSVDGALLPQSRLTTGDLARAGVHAEVVVLSGCATGDGGELRGEGVLGLTYGFLANGSRSVVAALWPIEDSSTARFMNEFYRAYRNTGRTAEALRTAQLRTRATTSPAIWSSFVVRANEFP
jgi:CHAT domain-containing protein/tetratricopeptide (TPR) repeat protein